MDFEIRAMTRGEAVEIAAWKYPPPYDFYDMTGVAGDIEGWIADGGRYSVFVEEALIGFLSFGEDARVPGGEYPDDALDIGVGLRPDLTGRGKGLPFVEAALAFARREFDQHRLRLTVARFNERAIRIYGRVGFEETTKFEPPGKDIVFIQMEREACTGTCT